jgi:uncharacterized protein (DUF1501 family)
VAVFLRGGADGLNLVVPFGDDEYYRLRGQIGIAQKDTHPLDDLFGLHPEMGPLMPVYNEGCLAVVHQAGSGDQTRSHFEAQEFMESGGNTGGGWLARYLRATTTTPGPLDAVALSKTLPDVLRGAPASVVMETFDTLAFGPDASAFTDTLGAMYAGDSSALGAAGRDMLAAMHKISEMARSEYRPEGGAAYGTDPFSEGLTRTARLVKSGLGVRAVSLDLNGWDSHFAQGTLFTPLVSQLATGLAAFRRDLGPLMDRVTVVVMSEFGRRVYENASLGTDHGRGGVMLVMGGGVRGGRVVHQWNGLAADSLEGPGDVPVVHDYRDVLAPVLLRHAPGVALEQVFPGHASRPLDLCQ